MPLRQRIQTFLARHAPHLRVASFLAAIAIILYLPNPWHNLLLARQTGAHFLQTQAIPALVATLLLATIHYSKLKTAKSNQFVTNTQKYKKLNPSIRFWLFLTPFILISVALLYSVPPAYVHQMGITDPKEALTHIETERKDLGALILSIFGAYGLFLTWRRTQTTEQGHITDRYSKAIEQLGAMKDTEKGKVPNIEVRLGAIYALERIAWDSPRDHWTIMEVLTAYIRENAPARPEPVQPEADPKRKTPTEIQAILDVLKRRNHEIEREGQTLNLSKTRLRGEFLCDVQMEGANLRDAYWDSAHLTRAVLKGAYLGGARLAWACLTGAHLERAQLIGVDLEGANLLEAHLEWASGITVKQIKSALNWELAHYDPEFRRQLGLPDES